MVSDGLVVRGGAGGVSAQLEHLDIAAAQLHRSAAAIGDAREALRWGRSALDAATASPSQLLAALDLEADLAAAWGALCGAQLLTHDLGSVVTHVVATYRASDAAAQAVWSATLEGVAVRGAHFWGPLLRAGAQLAVRVADDLSPTDDAAAAAGDGDGDGVAGQGAPAPAAVTRPPTVDLREPATTAGLPPEALGELVRARPVDGVAAPDLLSPAPAARQDPDPALLVGRDAAEAGLALAGAVMAGPRAVEGARTGVPAAAAWLVGRLREQGITAGPATTVRAVPLTPDQAVSGAPRSTADLLRRVQQTGGGGGGAGARVRVERLTTPAGAPAAVLYLPGTQTWSPSSTNPHDVTSNLEAVAQEATAISSASVQALREAGVTADDDLLVVGYSLGGLAGAEMVSDPAFLREYHPVGLVTAGSPIGAFDIPSQVEVVALEHTEDPVTQLEGASNPDTPTLTTVVADTPGGAAHALTGYLRTADAVDTSTDPSLTAARARLSPFLEATGSQVSDYVAERVR